MHIEDEAELWQVDIDGTLSLYDTEDRARRAQRDALSDGKQVTVTTLQIPRAWLFEGRYLYDHNRFDSAAEALEALRAGRR